MRGIQKALRGLGVCTVSLYAVMLAQAVPAQAATGINQQMSFEGKVVNASGINIADGTYNMEFKIYAGGSATGGGTLKWTEDWLVGASQGVTIKSGTFQVNLGSITPFGSSVDWNSNPLYLSMQVGNTASCSVTTTFQSNCGGDGEMSPYILLTAAPYAMNSNAVGGLTASQLARNDAANTFAAAQTIQQSSTTALVVQGAASSPVLTVDTSGNRLVLGKPGPSGINTSLVFSNATNANQVSLAVADGTAAYSLTLPSAAPATNQCLMSGSSTAGLLQWNSTCVNTIGTLQATSIANGANISGNTLTLGTADANGPGLVTNGAQTFGGTKTFNGSVLVSTIDTATATTLNIGAAAPTTSGISLNQTTTLAGAKNLLFASGAGYFDQSASTGTFATGSGNVSLNGNTTVASGKSFSVSSLPSCDRLTTGTTGTLACSQSADLHIGKIEVSGHSYAVGGGASSQYVTRYTSVLATLLHAQELNHAVGGAVAAWSQSGTGATGDGGYAKVLQDVKGGRSAAPYLPPAGIGIVNYGVNDLAAIGPSNLSKFQNALRTIIARYRASAVFEETSSTVTFAAGGGPAWTAISNNTNSGSGNGFEQANGNGNTYTINVPSDFPGGTVDVGLIATSDGNGAVHSFTVDGVSAGSIDTHNLAPSGHNLGIVKRFTGLSAGAHTIVGTISSFTGYTFFDYWQIESSPSRVVVVPLAARMPAYTIYGAGCPTTPSAPWTYCPTDADITTLNSDITSVASEFDSSVITVDIDSVLNKDSTNFYADNAHPNDQGHAKIAAAIYQALENSSATLSQLSYSASVPAYTGNNILFQNSNDTTTAFQVQNAAGTSTLFNIDTTNKRVGIGTTSPNALLDVRGDGTAGVTSQLLSQSASQFAGLSIGRTGNDLTLGVAGSSGNYSALSAVGDAVLRAVTGNLILTAQNNTGKILFSTGAPGSETAKAAITNAGVLQGNTLDAYSGTTLNLGQTSGGQATTISLNQTTTLAGAKNLLFASGAGYFDQSASTGTFATGSGNVSLNGNTTVASGKSFSVSSLPSCDRLTTGAAGTLACSQSADLHVNELEISGHSYAYGLGASSFNQRFTSKVAALLHAQELNHGISGAVLAYDQSANPGGYAAVLQNVVPSRTAAPYLAMPGVGLLEYGINDMAMLTPSGFTTPFSNALRTSIARYRAAAVFEDTDASVTYGGTWTAISGGACSSACSGSNDHYASANGATYTINVPADFPGGTVDVGLVAASDGSGAVHSFTVDGVAAGSVDTRNQAASGHYTGMVKRFTGLSAGAHTIVGTLSSITGSTYFDYWQIEAQTPRPVLVLKANRPYDYSLYASGWNYVPTDADITTINSAITSVVGEFDSSVVAVDTDTAINKQLNYFASDHLHLNDLGQSVMAATIYKAIGALTTTIDQMAQTAATVANSTNSMVFRNSNDSTTGFSIQNAASSTVLNVDTADKRVGIGTNAPAYQMDLRGTNASQFHLTNGTNDTDGYLTGAFGGLFASANVAWNGSSWVAKAATASILQQQNGTLTFLSDTGLTAGSTYTPTTRFSVDGTGLLTQGGNVTFSGTAARTITGPSTGGLSVTVAAGPLTLSTSTSGTLAVTSAGALNLTGAAASTWSVGAGNTLTVTSQNFNVTSAGALSTLGNINTTGGALQTNSTNRIDNSGNIVNAGNFTATAGSTFATTGTNGFIFKPGTNNTTAFQVQNSAGVPELLVDTTTYNLITNPGFETGTTGWSLRGSGSISQNTNKANAYNGLYSLDANVTAASSGASTNSFTQTITGNGSQQYTLSVYVKSSAVLSALRIGYNTGSDVACATTLATVVSGFQRLSCTFTLANGVSLSNVWIDNNTTGTAAHIYIDAVQLEANSVATAFSIGSTLIRGVITNPLSLQSQSDSTTALQVMNSAGTATTFDVDTLNKRVGIGKANPTQALDVVGTVNASTGYAYNGTAGSTVTCGNNQYLNQVVVQGGVITGNSGCNSVGLSDQRLKTNITSLSGTVLDDIRNVNAVNFDFDCSNSYFTDNHITCDTRLQTGVIAQQLMQIFPELVYQDEWGYYHVDYQGLSVESLKATVELAQHIDSAGNANFSTVVTPSLASSGALSIVSGGLADVSLDTTDASAAITIGGSHAATVTLSHGGGTTNVNGSLHLSFSDAGGGFVIDDAGNTQTAGTAIDITDTSGKGYTTILSAPNFSISGHGDILSNGGLTLIDGQGNANVHFDPNGNGTLAGNLNLASASLSGGLSVGGDLNIGGLSTFQKLATFLAKTIFHDDVEFQGHVTVANDTAGYAELRQGEASVHVTFTKQYATPPIVTASLTNGQFGAYAVNNVDTKGFDLSLQSPAAADTVFSWTALGVTNPQTAANPLPTAQ